MQLIFLHYYFKIRFKEISQIMLEVERRRKSFQFEEGFLFLSLIKNSISIEYLQQSTQQKPVGVTFITKLPLSLSDLFQTPTQLYEYLVSQPERIVTITEDRMQVAVKKGEKISAFEILFRKNYQSLSISQQRKIYILSEQLKIKKITDRENLKTLTKFNGELFSLLLEAQEKYHETLRKLESLKKEIQEKKKQKDSMKQLISQKKELLLKLRQRERLYINVD